MQRTFYKRDEKDAKEINKVKYKSFKIFDRGRIQIVVKNEVSAEDPQLGTKV